MKTNTNLDGSFYDKDYFENGRVSGKSWLVNYHWMPRRTFKEALAFIDYLQLDDNSYVLDYGCSKGFIVKALRELDIKADGCDISEYALSFAPEGCWNCSDLEEWKKHRYTHVVAKDVFEHLNPNQLNSVLKQISDIAPIIMCVIPMGDNGVYRIKEYHMDVSHLIIENETWWYKAFKNAGLDVIKECEHLKGLKDNWYHIPNGNHVFVLERVKCDK